MSSGNAQGPANFQPYIPASQSPVELTIRAVVLGSALGVVFAASSVYLAVKVGMTVSASIPIAVLSIAIFRALGKSSILENTIVQSAGSAGESLAFGVAAALPALLFMGYDISLSHALLVAGLGGVLGVLMMIPLRHGLIVQEHGKLTYPEGTACADVLIVGEKGGTEAKTVIAGFVVGALYKFAYAGLKLWQEVVEVRLGKAVIDPVTKKIKSVSGYLGGSMAIEVSPELLGVGYIIGPKVAGVTFAGGVLSYLILIPAISFFAGNLDLESLKLLGVTGTKTVAEMSPNQVRNAFVLYIGAGAVATGGLISLIRSFPTILSAFKRGLDTFLASRKGGAPSLLRTERDLPITVVIFGSLALVATIAIAPPLHINILSAVLIVIFGFFFVTVSSRITGEIGSSSNPISGMVVATLLITCLVYLLLGWTSPADRFMALTTAAIVGIAASNGGTTAQDLKTAYLVGGTPRSQQIALFAGVLTSAAFIGLTLVTLNKGATANIPEQHPGQRLTEISQETEVVHEWAFTVDESKGVGTDALAKALWAEGLELRGQAIRSFTARDAASLAGVELAVAEGSKTKLGEVGTLGAASDVTLQVGFARGQGTVPDGRYLVDAAGEVQYLVDPGIGGRVAEYLGKKLTRYDAPKARLFSLIIDGILTQKLPWTLVLLGVFIALMLELCGVASLPFAVGVYLPISTSAPIFAGGLVRYFIDRKNGQQTEAEAEFSSGTLISSGLIAGGAIAGVILAMLAIPAGGDWLRAIDVAHLVGDSALGQVMEGEHAHPTWAPLWGLAVFAALTFFLFRGAAKRAAK